MVKRRSGVERARECPMIVTLGRSRMVSSVMFEPEKNSAGITGIDDLANLTTVMGDPVNGSGADGATSEGRHGMLGPQLG